MVWREGGPILAGEQGWCEMRMSMLVWITGEVLSNLSEDSWKKHHSGRRADSPFPPEMDPSPVLVR